MSSCNYVIKTLCNDSNDAVLIKTDHFLSVKTWNLFFIGFFGYLLSESNPDGHKVGRFNPVLKKENKQQTSNWKSNSNWSIQHRICPDKDHRKSMKRPPQNPNRSYQS